MGSKLRLKQFLRMAGLFSSKKEMMDTVLKGEITIDDEVVKNPNYQINPNTRKVCWKGKQIKKLNTKIYIVMNKPEGLISTRLSAKDRELGKHSVFSIIDDIDDIPENEKKTLFAVGRLDEDTSGLLIITNDGKLGVSITSPERGIEKTYLALLESPLSEEDAKNIEAGIKIKLEENGKQFYYKTRRCRVKIASDDRKQLEIAVSEGRKREVRRIFEAVGNKVTRLQRVSIGHLRLDELKLKKGDCMATTRQFLIRKVFF